VGAMALRQGFAEYYEPSREDLWGNGIVVFDTNILLDFYEFTPQTRDEAFAALSQIRGRLWLPHQVAEEYQRDRLRVLLREHKKANESIAKVVKTIDDIPGSIKASTAQQKSMARVLAPLRESIRTELEKVRPVGEPQLVKDDIDERFVELFGEQVGRPLDDAERAARYDEIKVVMRRKSRRVLWMPRLMQRSQSQYRSATVTDCSGSRRLNMRRLKNDRSSSLPTT
jgi:hypothetical protein